MMPNSAGIKPSTKRWKKAKELPPRQVAGAAEDDDRLRLSRRLHRHQEPSSFTAWPPNSLRSAAMTFAENDSSWREANRLNSAIEVIGAGTFSSIAASIVHRPSPESST